MRLLTLLLFTCFLTFTADAKKPTKELWPDGTPIAQWFSDTAKRDINTLGRQYLITDYGVVSDSTMLQTTGILAS